MKKAENLILPLTASYLTFRDVLHLLQVSKTWKDSLCQQLSQVHLFHEGIAPIDLQAADERRKRYLKYFPNIKYLSIAHMEWFDSWVNENEKLFQQLIVLAIDRLSFDKPFHTSPEEATIINTVEGGRTGLVLGGGEEGVSRLNQLFLGHYNGHPHLLFHHILTPGHPLHYLHLDSITFLTDQHLCLLFQQYPVLEGLTVSGSFFITSLEVPLSSQKYLKELSITKCPRFSHLMIATTTTSTTTANTTTSNDTNTATTSPTTNTGVRSSSGSSSGSTTHGTSSWKLTMLRLSCPKLRRLFLCGCNQLFTSDEGVVGGGSGNRGGGEGSAGRGSAGEVVAVQKVVTSSYYNETERGQVVIDNHQEIVNSLDRLFIHCPMLDVNHFLEWGIGGTVLFAMREELKEIFLPHHSYHHPTHHHHSGSGGSHTPSRGQHQHNNNTTSPLQHHYQQQDMITSPLRPGELRKRNSFA
eukprot:scaffold106_cov177-Ochromonas_danica.AAC.10